MKIYQVTSAIYLSGTIDDYDKLLKSRIDVVVNCRSENHDHIDELTKRGIAYYWIPVPEGQAPRNNQISLFLFLMAKRPREENTLIHCSEGRGRSPMLICAYLRSLGIEMNRAWNLIKESKKDVSLTEVQLSKLCKYFKGE